MTESGRITSIGWPRKSMSAPAFVYVAPARYEDILKLGFSHDPCNRIRSFHRRYFEYFDLQRSFAIAVVDEQDARRIERVMASRFADHRMHAPLEIETAPGGVTEWYRGAYEELVRASVDLIETGGYPPLLNMADEIADRLRAESFAYRGTTDAGTWSLIRGRSFIGRNHWPGSAPGCGYIWTTSSIGPSR